MREWVGEWSGTYRLWLTPDDPGRECRTSLSARDALDGRFVVLEYDWSVDGEPARGVMLCGPAPEMAWVDSWHNGDSVMFCWPVKGGVDGGRFNVIGSYGPPAERWGWRTTIEVRGASSDELVVTAFNITPAGEEAMATEAVYRRV